MTATRTLILGAAGRDFHDFLTYFRDNPSFDVRGFTATQIPYIDERRFPAVLAGPHYPDGIAIHPETALEELISREAIDVCYFAYSDLSAEQVMTVAARVHAAGAAFALLGPRQTQLHSQRPVIAVTATRTGAGKSPLCQWLATGLTAAGVRVAVLRHPMPYGDLARQAVQRFASRTDLDRHDCTIEEREEYTPYIDAGLAIYAGVDYAAILTAAERDADLVLWDGGNNDTSFVVPDLQITIADALRPGHEASYYPAQTNIRTADIIAINKVDEAAPEVVDSMRTRIAALNPNAQIVETGFAPRLDRAIAARVRRIVVVEDSPTVTHGGMAFGAGLVALRRDCSIAALDPRPFAVGSLRTAFASYPHIGPVLPALGYSASQREDLRATLVACAPDLIVDASPAGIDHIGALPAPCIRVRYGFVQRAGAPLAASIDAFLASKGIAAKRFVGTWDG